MGCILIILCLLGSIIAQLPLVCCDQQQSPYCNINEEFYYRNAGNLTAGYTKVLTRHTIEVVFQAQETEAYQVTLYLSTQEKVVSVAPYASSSFIYSPTNSSKNGELTVSVMESGSSLMGIVLELNETSNPFDPLNITTIPSACQSAYPLTPDGQFSLQFLVNNSEFLDSCSLSLGPLNEGLQAYSTLKRDSMDCPTYSSVCTLTNVSAGNGIVQLNTQTNSLSASFFPSVTASRHHLITQMRCYLNGTEAQVDGIADATYSEGCYQAYLQQDPTYFFTGGQQYSVNFTSQGTFQLRIDPTSREQINFLALSKLPSNFSVTQEEFLGDEPCYVFTFYMDMASICSLGLDLKTKGWFIDPENMSLEQIPTAIKDKYLTSAGSPLDGNYFDLDKTSVQEWAKGVVGNETNPYKIADLVFQNVTQTLTFSPNWQELEGQTFNESVTQILTARTGVCRHYARLFAALCICSGLPARTVPGTAFSFLNQTWKKNHEWDEVYLPRCGWVTIDPSWGQEFLLSDQHASITLAPFFKGNANVTCTNETSSVPLKLQSRSLLSFLIQTCEQSLGDNKSIQSEILLDQAKLYAEKGDVQDALLNIAKAYTLTSNAEPTKTTAYVPSAEQLLVVVVIAVLLLIGGFLTFRHLKKKITYIQFFRKAEIRTKLSRL